MTWLKSEDNWWNVLDTDGVYGLVPQRAIDEEDEKLRAWMQDADLVTVDLFMCDLSLLQFNGQIYYSCWNKLTFVTSWW